jgi:hypothetical protein
LTAVDAGEILQAATPPREAAMLKHQPGFVEALLDFTFASFITEKLIPVLYVLSVIAFGLIALFLIVEAFTFGIAEGILVLLIVAPLYFIISVVYIRVILEFLIVVFRIHDYVREIAEQGRRGQWAGRQ